MNPTPLEWTGTTLFALALLHTFSVNFIRRWALRYKFLHPLSEVELVFGLWAAIYLLIHAFVAGLPETIGYLTSLSFTEPVFVFVILLVSTTKPVLDLAETLINKLSARVPINKPLAFYFTALTVGPLLGSLITEPAAMAVTAMILLKRFYAKNISTSLMYATLGLLFVNISIGGTLTPFAAPPILMVAPVWGWDLKFVFLHLGWRGILACVLSTSLTTLYFRRELSQIPWLDEVSAGAPAWLITVQLLVLTAIVVSAHHVWPLILLMFVVAGIHRLTRVHQQRLQMFESFLVAFFLAGLVVIGPLQRWWLEPLLLQAGSNALFWGATLLTAITDNAALTYLGAQVPTLTEAAKIALVSGAVVGGGLTIVANAPNPAGYAILNPGFKNGINPLGLLAGAILPTLIAAFCFWLI